MTQRFNSNGWELNLLPVGQTGLLVLVKKKSIAQTEADDRVKPPVKYSRENG